MEHVVLVIHLILALAIIALVLLQRSEGGGLGIGGGGGGLGGLATAGQTANAMTKATAFCAACFFVTSLVLGILAGTHSNAGSILDQLDNGPAPLVINEEGGVTDTDMEALAPADQPEDLEDAEVPEVPASPEERPSVPVE